ncbi:MAG: hypothetical protein HW391_1251 [Chloroflexi bacterium]|nr:hypothetical protein [Chloroflexota bacterium]
MITLAGFAAPSRAVSSVRHAVSGAGWYAPARGAGDELQGSFDPDGTGQSTRRDPVEELNGLSTSLGEALSDGTQTQRFGELKVVVTNHRQFAWHIEAERSRGRYDANGLRVARRDDCRRAPRAPEEVSGELRRLPLAVLSDADQRGVPGQAPLLEGETNTDAPQATRPEAERQARGIAHEPDPPMTEVQKVASGQPSPVDVVADDARERSMMCVEEHRWRSYFKESLGGVMGHGQRDDDQAVMSLLWEDSEERLAALDGLHVVHDHRAAGRGHDGLNPSDALDYAGPRQKRHHDPDGVRSTTDQIAGARVRNEPKVRHDPQDVCPRLRAHIGTLVQHPAHRGHADSSDPSDILDRSHRTSTVLPDDRYLLTAMVAYPPKSWKRFQEVEKAPVFGASIR